MEDPDAQAQAEALADELTRVRGRGLNEVDEVRGRPGATGRQEALRLPGLDRLRAARGLDRGSRALDLRVLLWDGLDEFGREFPGDAAVVRSLYFDGDGRPPPPRGASLLLRQARGEVSESAFRRRQRGLLERFAAFLLAREATASQEGPPPLDAATPVSAVAGTAEELAAPRTAASAPEPGARAAAPHDPAAAERPGTVAARPRSRLTGAALAVLVAAAAVLLTLLVTELAGPADSDAGEEEADRTDDGAVSAPIRFNSLGGTTSKVIDLYDDPRVPSDEAAKTATYLDGQTSRAWCVTRGRTVTSDVARGEEDRRSDRWLLVDGPPDVTAYATLTYLDVDPDDLARLPACP